MVVIKKMEMPKCCGECYLCDFSECGFFCPLLSVECPLKEVK